VKKEYTKSAFMPRYSNCWTLSKLFAGCSGKDWLLAAFRKLYVMSLCRCISLLHNLRQSKNNLSVRMFGRLSSLVIIAIQPQSVSV
jgi:hypothetical protein